MKKQISLRISALTESQLTELTSKLGMTQTDIVTMAVNNFYDMMEEKMNTKILSQAHYDIIDWIGDDGDTIHNMTDDQAHAFLHWLKSTNYSLEEDEYKNFASLKTALDHIDNLNDLPAPGDARISVDNGLSWSDPAEAIKTVGWDVIAMMMNDDVRDYVNRYDHTTNVDFLTDYLKHAPCHLIIG